MGSLIEQCHPPPWLPCAAPEWSERKVGASPILTQRRKGGRWHLTKVRAERPLATLLPDPRRGSSSSSWRSTHSTHCCSWDPLLESGAHQVTQDHAAHTRLPLCSERRGMGGWLGSGKTQEGLCHCPCHTHLLRVLETVEAGLVLSKRRKQTPPRPSYGQPSPQSNYPSHPPA